MGFRVSTIRFTSRLYVLRRYSPRSGSPSAPSMIWARSAPAEKPFPSPRTTMQRTSSSAASPRSMYSSSCMVPSKAFSFFGRFRATFATPPPFSKRMFSYKVSLLCRISMLRLRRRLLHAGAAFTRGFCGLIHASAVGLGEEERADPCYGADHGHVGADGERGAGGGQERGSDDRGQRAAEDRADLVPHRGPRVADLGREDLRVERGLRPVHHAQEDLGQNQREHERPGAPAVHERPEGEQAPQAEQDGAGHVGYAASYKVGEGREARNGDEACHRGDQDGRQDRGLRQPDLRRGVVEDVGYEDVEVGVYGYERTCGERYLLGVGPQDLPHRGAGGLLGLAPLLLCLVLLAVLLQVPEGRGVLQLELDVEPEPDQQHAKEERYPPGPRDQRPVAEGGGDYQEEDVGDQDGHRHADLGEAAVEAALL